MIMTVFAILLFLFLFPVLAALVLFAVGFIARIISFLLHGGSPNDE